MSFKIDAECPKCGEYGGLGWEVVQDEGRYKVYLDCRECNHPFGSIHTVLMGDIDHPDEAYSEGRKKVRQYLGVGSL